MPFPVSITKITIGATFIKSDGSPCTGLVTFRPSATAVVDEYIFPTKTINAPLHPDGSFSVSLVATDDPDWDVPGATYQVIERINGVDPWRVYNIQVPYDSPGGLLDLASVAPVDPPPTGGGGDPGTLDPDLVTIGNLIPSNNDVIQRKAGNWTNRSPAQLKVDLALDLVDNVADVDKPISTATQAALDLKMNQGVLTKADVGLANVDNTSDVSKPVSTATQAALGLKADQSAVDLKANLTDLTKANVGLGNVDNTSDLAKPISTATSTAINTKADTSVVTAHTGSTSNPHAVTKTQVGLGSVDNTSDVSKPVSTATQNALDLKAPLASPTFTGTVGGVTKSMVGLSNVDNTSDTAKPVSTAQQTALNLKADLASPTFTGTVGGITKAMVGLSAVDNTADTAKPVSTAQQTALNGKLDQSVATTKGDLFVATASGAVTRLGVGTNGQVVTADSTLASGVKWATPAAGGAATLWQVRLVMKSGRYYSAPLGAIGPNTTGAAGNAFLIPVVFDKNGTVNGLSIDTATAGTAGALTRFGLASSAADYDPSAWIADFGTVASNGVGANALTTMSQAVLKDTLYWFGVVSQVSNTVYRAVGSGNGFVGFTTAPTGGATDCGFTSTGWTGAVTGPITIAGVSTVPRLGIRFA